MKLMLLLLLLLHCCLASNTVDPPSNGEKTIITSSNAAVFGSGTVGLPDNRYISRKIELLVFHRKDPCNARPKPEMSPYFQMKCTMIQFSDKVFAQIRYTPH